MAFKLWLGLCLFLAITISIDSVNPHQQYLTQLYNQFRLAFWYGVATNIRQFAVVSINRLNPLPQIGQSVLPLTHPEDWNAAFYYDTLPAHTEPVLFDNMRQMVLDYLQQTGHLPQDIYLYTHNIPCSACTAVIVAFVENFRGYIQEFVNNNPQFANALGEVGQLAFRIGWNRESGNYDETLATLENFLDTDDNMANPRIVMYRRLTLDGTCNWNRKKKRQATSAALYLPNSWYETNVKRMKHISTEISGVWAVDENDSIYYRPETYGVSDAKGPDRWEVVSGSLKQVDVGYNVVWGVTSNNEIFRRVGITKNNPTGTSLEKLAGLLKHVSVSSKGNVWGVNVDDYVFVRTGQSWTNTDGRLSQISVGGAGVWGVNWNDHVFYRAGTFGDTGSIGSGWNWVEGSLKYISSGEYAVWGVNEYNDIFYRYGITATRPGGVFWVSLSGKLKQVEVSVRGMWGVDQNNVVHGRQSSPSFDLEPTWTGISPSGLHYVSTGWSGVWAVNFIDKTVFYREYTYGSNSNSKGSNGWMAVDGKMDQLDVGKGVVWGVYNGKILFREGLSRDNPKGDSWAEIHGQLRHVTVSPAGYVWGVNFQHYIFRRLGITENNPRGTHWTYYIPGRLVQISAGLAGVWGVNFAGDLFYRAGTAGDLNTDGTGWITVIRPMGRPLKHVSSGENSVWVTTSDDDIYRRQGITETNPTGTVWLHVPGKLRQVEIYDDHNGVWGINSGRDLFARKAC